MPYRCPGETYEIDRAVHLGRLAAFYPACKRCEHRVETFSLGLRQQRDLAEVAARPEAAPRWTTTSLHLCDINALDPPLIRRVALALANVLWNESPRGLSPIVLVGADGDWATAGALAKMCETLELAGCRAVECGAVTGPSLAMLALREQADAALRIGNASGLDHSIAIEFWGQGGVPWMSPGNLDPLVMAFDDSPARPKRRGGSRGRADADANYLAALAPLYHGLRPLRFVVDSQCTPLLSHVRKLSSDTACQITQPKRASAAVAFGPPDPSLLASRLSLLAAQVVTQHQHFGIWIDGSGQQCHLVDDLGRVVGDEALRLLLVGYICRQQPGATIAVPPGTSELHRQALFTRGAKVVQCEAAPLACWTTLRQRGAVFGGAGGRWWYAGPPPVTDGLATLSLLLTILSQSDRPLSDVLAAG